MVTTDENGILRDLEREERIIVRQALLKKLWKLRVAKGDREKPAKSATVRPVVASDTATASHGAATLRTTDLNLELGTAD